MDRSPEEQRTVDLEHLRLLRLAYFISAGVAGLYFCMGLLYIVLGTFITAMPEYMAATDGGMPSGFFTGFGVVLCVLGGLTVALRLAVAKCLRERRSFGFCMFVAAISCIEFPYGTVLGVGTIITLTRSSVRDLFEGRGHEPQSTPAVATGKEMLKYSIPVLHVSSSATAEKFFRDGLGFRLHFTSRPADGVQDPCYMSFVRDRAVIHTSSFAGDGVPGGVVQLIVDDVDALYEEFRARGVEIDLAPIDQTWGNREMYVKDQDQNSLRFVKEQ